MSTAEKEKAFTLPELLIVVFLVGIVGLVAFPAMARAKAKNLNAGCLSNLRQMMNASLMYSEDNSDSLMLNSPAGGANGWSGANTEDWVLAAGNTNVATLASGLMYPYLANDVTVFRCPADIIPAINGPRLRSYSMNIQFGITAPYNSPWRIYKKRADLSCPGPANTFVLCDENPMSINDGTLQVNLISPSFPDIPAAYMGAAGGFGFADGHAEIHRWVTSALLIPVQRGVAMSHISVASTNADYLWLQAHASCNP
jgi:prepilin-type N-terminal cleavage/methylation domain-containing protein